MMFVQLGQVYLMNWHIRFVILDFPFLRILIKGLVHPKGPHIP